ncbi:MAG: cupredoxin domain-containing protein [Acidimicrobiales bacterium]
MGRVAQRATGGALAASVAVLALVGAAPAPSGAQSAPGSGARVQMIRFAFEPATVTVPAGTTVTWTYDESATDPVPNCEAPLFQLSDPIKCPGHSTTSVDGLWDSGVHRAEGFPFSFTFSQPGTYDYFCSIHGGENPNNPLTAMNGTVVVTAAADGPTAGTGGDAGAGDSTAVSGVDSDAQASTRSPGGSLAATGGPALVGAGVVLLAAGLALRRARHL